MTRAKENLALNLSLVNLYVESGDSFETVVHMKEKKAQDHRLACRVCEDQLTFEDNVLGLQSEPIDVDYASRENGHCSVKKKKGLFCSVCASGAYSKDLKIKTFGVSSQWKWKTMKNRQFLRYFVGALPEKYQDALNKIQQSKPPIMVANVFYHGHNMLQGMFQEFIPAAHFEESDEDDESDESEDHDEIDQEVLAALEEDF